MKKIKLYQAIILTITLLLSMVNVVIAEEPLTPYKEHILPCFINGADFDEGGEGTAYSPLSGKRQGMYNYREGIELNFYNNSILGITMGVNQNEWLKYTVTAPTDGTYEIAVSYAVPSDDSEAQISIEGGAASLNAALDNTGGWNTLGEVTMGKIKLKAGPHVVKFSMTAGSITFKGISFEKLDESTVKIDYSKNEGSYKNVFIPSIIEGENYDRGEKGCLSVDGKNNGKAYRKNEPMDIYQKEDGGYKIAFSEGEFARYTFNAEVAGAYLFEVLSPLGGKMQMYFDDYEKPVEATSKTDISTKITSIYLEKGVHSICVSALSNLEIDKITVSRDKVADISLTDLKNTENNSEKTDNIYKEFYVSTNGNDDNNGTEKAPFKTIQRAKEEVLKYNSDMTGDIVVNIMDGEYFIDKVIEFNENDGGNNGYDVVYRGYNRFSPPVINGGTKISGWSQINDYLWAADTEIEDTRTLYINELPAKRARSKYKYEGLEPYKKDGSSYSEDGIAVSDINFPENLTNTGDMELVWDLYWTSQRVPVESISYEPGKAVISMDQPYYSMARSKSYDGTSPKADSSFYLENAFELLDEPGEFYFDKITKRIYYYPFSEEDLEKSNVYAGTCEMMVAVDGGENKIKNIIFDNLDFRYGAWNEASVTGVVGVQADKLVSGEKDAVSSGGKMLPAQVQVSNAENVAIKNCKFSCLGSGAIAFDNGVSNSQISKNTISDCSGTAIIVGHWDHRSDMPEGMERCVNIEVSDNIIRRAAWEYRGCCAITLYYVNSVSVVHNDIKDVPYTGISMGWGWGADIKECQNNTIAYNRIENVTNPTEDGAHIYMLGPMRNSTIHDNYLIKAGDARGGIYCDQGTGYVSIFNNVVRQSELWLHGQTNVGHKEIKVYDNFSDTNEELHDPANVTVENTTVVRDNNWPDTAVSIMNNSGVSYKNTKIFEYPIWRTNLITNIPKDTYQGSGGKWIQAENYMSGGENVGYHKALGGSVSLYSSTGENKVVGNTQPGDWLKYECTVAKDGEYNLILKTANAFAITDIAPKVNIYLDDALICDKMEIPNNGSWKVHIPVNVGKYELIKGIHQIKIEFVDNGFSFDAWKFDEMDINATDPNFDEGEYVEQSAPDIGFLDISEHWARGIIEKLANEGIINGVSQTEFCPDSSLTKYQAIWLLMRVLKIEYTDENLVDRAKEMGIDLPEKDYPISRQEFASFVMKCYGYVNSSYDIKYNSGTFLDIQDIDKQYLYDVLAVKTMGFFTGDENNMFNPTAQLSRAEGAAVISRLR